jgi:hypothetical protein
MKLRMEIDGRVYSMTRSIEETEDRIIVKWIGPGFFLTMDSPDVGLTLVINGEIKTEMAALFYYTELEKTYKSLLRAYN